MKDEIKEDTIRFGITPQGTVEAILANGNHIVDKALVANLLAVTQVQALNALCIMLNDALTALRTAGAMMQTNGNAN